LKIIKNMTDDPRIIKEVERLLSDLKNYEPNFPLLGEGAIPLGPKQPLESSVKAITPKTGLVGQDPKTGRFFGTLLGGEKTQSLGIPSISRQNTANTTITTVPKKVIPNTTIKTSTKSSLLEEAKKFKSADEFIEAQPKVYHGSLEGRVTKLEDKPFFVSPDKNMARSYGKEISNFYLKDGKKADLQDVELLKKVVGIENYNKGESIFKKLNIQTQEKVLKNNLSGLKRDFLSKSDESLLSDYLFVEKPTNTAVVFRQKQIQDKLKKLGFDYYENRTGYGDTDFGASYMGSQKPEIIVLNKDILKTKSQLKDIWNKENKNKSLGGASHKMSTAKTTYNKNANFEVIETDVTNGTFFSREADKWLRSSDYDAKQNAYDYATRDFPELGKSLREEFFNGNVPKTIKAYRTSTPDGVTSFFPEKSTAESYAKRFGTIDDVESFNVSTDNLIPSGSGSGEFWAMSEDVIDKANKPLGDLTK